jgi:hypothetical protein
MKKTVLDGYQKCSTTIPFAPHKSFVEVIRRLLALSNQWRAGVPACGSPASLPALSTTQQVDDEHKLTRHRSLTVVGAALYHPHTSAVEIPNRTNQHRSPNTGGSNS